MPPKKRQAQPANSTRKSKLTKTHHNGSKGLVVQPGKDTSWGFFKLPREIRDVVYEHLCVFSNRRVLVPCKQSLDGCPADRQPEPAIAATCQQAREEALHSYYSRNRFAIPKHNFDFDGLQRWVDKTIKEFLPIIKDLYLIFGGTDGFPNPKSWMRIRSSFSSGTVKLRGNIDMSSAFEKACDIAFDLKQRKLDWKTICDVLRMCGEMRQISSPRGDGWSDPFDDDDEDMLQEMDELHVEFCARRCRTCGHDHCLEAGMLEPDDTPVLASNHQPEGDHLFCD